MPTFRYKVRDKSGSQTKGVIEGESKDQVAKSLEEKEYTLVSIEEIRPLTGGKFLQRYQRGKRRDIGVFTRQLATLVKTGVPLLSSLHTLEKQTERDFLKEAVGEVAGEVERGTHFYTALEHHPKIFNKVYTNMVKAGEASGSLVEVLNRLADLIEYEIETRAKIFGVLLYPMIALCCLFIGFVVLTVFVLPQIVKIFEGLKGELPIPTLILLKSNYIMQNYWYVVFGILILCGFGFFRFIKTKKGRKLFDRFILKIPLIGAIISKLIMSRFARVVSILVKSGVPILTVLDLAGPITGNVVISEAIDKIKGNVEGGKGMAEPMRITGVFSPMVVQMVALGEETGELDKLLYEVSNHYDREATHAVMYLATIIEPIIIVALAIGVLVIALGIFLPMWNAYNLIIKGGAGV